MASSDKSRASTGTDRPSSCLDLTSTMFHLFQLALKTAAAVEVEYLPSGWRTQIIYRNVEVLNREALRSRVSSERAPDISFSRSNMALVASSCSQLTGLLWGSSARGKVSCSFPLLLFTPLDSLNATLSVLLEERVWKWRHDGPSASSPATPPFWLQWGTSSGSRCGSSSSTGLAEASDSWDLDRRSPLKIILKWEVRGLSESSFLSWAKVSPVDSTAFAAITSSSGSPLSGSSEEALSCWEMMMVGIVEAPGFSEGAAVESAFKDSDTASFWASVSGLGLCKGKRTQSGCDSWPPRLRPT